MRPMQQVEQKTGRSCSYILGSKVATLGTYAVCGAVVAIVMWRRAVTG
jgi:hypothetical protein